MNDLRSQQSFLVEDNDHNLPYFHHTNKWCLHQYHSCQQLNRWIITVVAFIVANHARVTGKMRCVVCKSKMHRTQKNTSTTKQKALHHIQKQRIKYRRSKHSTGLLQVIVNPQIPPTPFGLHTNGFNSPNHPTTESTWPATHLDT
jgi:hypothetical protein